MSTVPIPVPVPVPSISCADGCGRKADEVEILTWNYLCIQNRYRCWPCTHLLTAASTKESN